ncbi:hypothetical protein CRG98_014180 [Punica granatum]|uniref:Uncharacterized protein n=1 Tax=Punica granatum TaxID=22663 RepID=A0A2I0KA68_PUNGR|nr:hypothetical protein CRG98_014180 [Punica granatum]
MLGWNPKAVNVGPGPESSKCRIETRYGAEAQEWGRSPMRGQNPKAGPKPDAVNAGAGARCSKCVLVDEILVCCWTPSVEAKDVFFCSLEIPLIKGRMLGEVWTLGNHSSPRIQDLFDVTLAICGCLILPPSMFKSSSRRILEDRLGSSYLSVTCSQNAVEGPNGLSHEGYLITTPSDHLEDNAGQGRIDETMRARE